MTSAKRLFSGQNITCIRQGRVLFQNLSFTVEAGGILHLTGVNGSGKTSLLRVMAGVLPIAEGIMSELPENSFLPPEDRHLKSLETVLENMTFWAGVWGVARDQCRISLAAMKITHLQDRPARYLSAGQKRRVSIAIMMMKPARLWLLDEPLNALDAETTADFYGHLAAHLAGGGAAVIASHQGLDLPATQLHIGRAV